MSIAFNTMAGILPTSTDTDYTLWKKVAWNLYDNATTNGITGLKAPNWNDPEDILLKKIAYYSAAIADLP